MALCGILRTRRSYLQVRLARHAKAFSSLSWKHGSEMVDVIPTKKI
jgi:hypothetical protein